MILGAVAKFSHFLKNFDLCVKTQNVTSAQEATMKTSAITTAATVVGPWQ